jgi:hypothetical protein
MKNTLLYLFLSAALATPVCAQSAATTKHPKSSDSKATVRPGKHSAGEATSLENKELGAGAEERETREDNHGRLTAAHHAKLRHQPTHAARATSHGAKSAKIVAAHSKDVPGHRPPSQPHHAAALRTGQLTTTDAPRFQTKKTGLKPEARGARAHSSKATSPEAEPPNQPDDKSPNRLRLKKHNARMF